MVVGQRLCKHQVLRPHVQAPNTACPARGSIIGIRARCFASDDGAASRATAQENPLELLRVTKDPVQRAKLLGSLGSKLSTYTEAYQPTEVETCLSTELGVWQQTVMQVAVSNPDLVTYDVQQQVKPTIRALKDANIAPEDIWFLVSKRPFLLAHPTPIQRWLDFLRVYGLTPNNTQNFLLRASNTLILDTTLYAAGQVVTFLKTLGIKDEFLAQRVLAVWPQVLERDVEQQLRPIVLFLMRMGIEVTDLRSIVCAWPDLLLCDVDSQLQPWVTFLKTHMGCSTEQVAELIQTCPHILGFKPEVVFKSHIENLSAIGITQEDMAKMSAQTIGWMTTPGGITQQLAFLTKQAGFTAEQARQLVLSAPGLLSEKDFELERKWTWLTDNLGVSKEQVLACPQALSLGLMKVLGPRHGFLVKQDKLHQICTDEAGAPSLPGTQGRIDLHKLCLPIDYFEWCTAQDISPLDFGKYRAHWEEEFTQGLIKSAAQEFQDELKKLGIYEGTD